WKTHRYISPIFATARPCLRVRQNAHARLLPRSANDAQSTARAAAGVEAIVTAIFEPADERAVRHREGLENLSRGGSNATDLVLAGLHGAVPELGLRESDARDQPVRLYGAKDAPRFWIDLPDAPPLVFADPQSTLGPGETRSVVVLRPRYDGNDLAG